MQSQRRNKTVLYSKLQAKKASNTNNNNNNKKCSSVSLQTDTFPNFNALCNLHAMSMEEIKEHYQSTLKFLNLCHNFFNAIFSGQSKEFNTNGYHQCWDFKVPELPNYFKVLEFYLNKLEFNDISVQKKVNDEDNEDEQVLFDLKEFLPTSSSNNAVIINTESLNENFSKNNSRLVKSERNILKTTRSIEELKATTSSNFEEIFKTCNEFPKKSIEYLLENDIPLNEPYSFRVYQKKKKIKAETADQLITGNNLESGDQEMFYQDEFYEKNFEINTKSQIESNKGFNLLEYALKYSPQLNLTHRKSLEKTNRKLPLPIISSQQKVNEMFENISKESLIEKNDNNTSDNNILEKFAKLMNYEELSTNPRREEELIETTSSGESVILNDEEFAKRRFKRTYKISYRNYVLNGTDDVSD